MLCSMQPVNRPEETELFCFCSKLQIIKITSEPKPEAWALGPMVTVLGIQTEFTITFVENRQFQ